MTRDMMNIFDNIWLLAQFFQQNPSQLALYLI